MPSVQAGAPIISAHNKTIQLLPRQQSGAATLHVLNAPTNTDHCNSLSFWQQVGIAGAYLSTGNTVDVYETICDISGSGYLTHLISACLAANGTITFRVTVDGEEQTITAAAWTGYRIVAGALMGTTAAEQQPNQYNAAISSINDQESAGINGAISHRLVPSSHFVLSEGLSSVRFESSLKVEVVSDQLVDTTGYYECRGAMYVLDA